MKQMLKYANQINSALLVLLISFLVILNGLSFDNLDSNSNFNVQKFKESNHPSKENTTQISISQDSAFYLYDTEDLDPDDEDGPLLNVHIPIVEYLQKIFSNQLLSCIYQTNSEYHYFIDLQKSGLTFAKSEPSDLQVFLI